MRHLAPKLHLRSMLALIALVALALGYGKAQQRWATCGALARHHAELEEGCLWTAQQCVDNVVEYERRRQEFVRRGDVRGAQICVENSGPYAPEARRLLREAEYHGRLRKYYESRW